MGGKHKQAQRVKNNTRPSSSGRSAERLGTVPPPFATTFTNLNKENATFSLIDDPTLSQLDPTLDPQFQLVLKKMNKKDGTTKLKALQEFRQLLETSDAEAVGLVTGLWCRVYVTLLTGIEGRVREAAHRAHEIICARAARSLAPHIRLIAAPWLASQYDTYYPAAQAAKDSLLAAFPDSAKRDQLAMKCRRQIIQQALDALNTEPRDERVISCALCATSAALQQKNINIDVQKLDEIDLLKKILENPRFWKPEGDSEKIGWATLLASLCHEPWRESTNLDCTKVLKCVLPNLFNSIVPDSLTALWDIVILLLPQYSSNLDLNRVLVEPLLKQLRDPGPGIVTRICPALLPLCARLPPENEQKSKMSEDLKRSLDENINQNSSELIRNQKDSEKNQTIQEFLGGPEGSQAPAKNIDSETELKPQGTPSKILEALLQTIQKPYIQHSRVELTAVSSAYMDLVQFSCNETGLSQLIIQIYTPEQDSKRLKTINIEISKLLKRWKNAEKIWLLLSSFIKNDSINQMLIADLILTLNQSQTSLEKNRVQFIDQVCEKTSPNKTEEIVINKFYLDQVKKLEQLAVNIWLQKCELGALLTLVKGSQDPNLIPKGAFETILPIFRSNVSILELPNLVELIFIILGSIQSQEETVEILDTLPFEAIPFAIREAQKTFKTYQSWLTQSQKVQKVYLNTAIEISELDFESEISNESEFNFELLKVALGVPLLCSTETLNKISEVVCSSIDRNSNCYIHEISPLICKHDPLNLTPRLFKISCCPNHKDIDEFLLIEIVNAWVESLRKNSGLTKLVLNELYKLVEIDSAGLLNPLFLILTTNVETFDQVFFGNPFRKVEEVLTEGVLLSNYIQGTFQENVPVVGSFPSYNEVLSWLNWKKLIGQMILKLKESNLDNFISKLPKNFLKKVATDFLTCYALGATFLETYTHLNFSDCLQNWVTDSKKLVESLKIQLDLSEKDWFENAPSQTEVKEIQFWSLATSFLVSEGLLPIKTLGPLSAPYQLYLMQAVAQRGLLKPERIPSGLGRLVAVKLNCLAEHDSESIETILAEATHALKGLNLKNLDLNEKTEALGVLAAARNCSVSNEKLIDLATVFLAEFSGKSVGSPEIISDYIKFIWGYCKLTAVHLSNLNGDQKKEFDELFSKDVKSTVFNAFRLIIELGKNGSPLVWSLTEVVYNALMLVSNGEDVLWGLSLGAIEVKNVPIQICGFYILKYLCESAEMKGGKSPGHFSQKLLSLLGNEKEMPKGEVSQSGDKNITGAEKLGLKEEISQIDEKSKISLKEEISGENSKTGPKMSQPDPKSSQTISKPKPEIETEIYDDLSCVLAWGAASGLHAAWELENVEKFLRRLLTYIPNEPKDDWFSLGSENELQVEKNLTKTLQKVACHTFSRYLTDAGASCRNWWLNSNLSNSERQRVERLTAKHVTRRAIKAQLATKYLPEGVKCSLAGRLIQAECYIEDARIELKIELREAWPLGQLPPTVEAKPAPHRDRLMQITLAAVAGAPLHRLLKLWKDAVDRRYEGLDECHICFSLLYAATAQLPKLKCPTCKKSFHSACLYRWFSTSNKSTCPLCRNLF